MQTPCSLGRCWKQVANTRQGRRGWTLYNQIYFTASDHHQRIARSHHSIASFLLFSTNAAISSPQIPSGLLPSFNPSTCFLNSGKSKTTQFCTDSGSVGSHLVICALLGTRCGGMSERPRWRSSKMKATSVSSIGSRLNVKGAGLEPDSEQKESLRT